MLLIWTFDHCLALFHCLRVWSLACVTYLSWGLTSELQAWRARESKGKNTEVWYGPTWTAQVTLRWLRTAGVRLQPWSAFFPPSLRSQSSPKMDVTPWNTLLNYAKLVWHGPRLMRLAWMLWKRGTVPSVILHTNPCNFIKLNCMYGHMISENLFVTVI